MLLGIQSAPALCCSCCAAVASAVASAVVDHRAPATEVVRDTEKFSTYIYVRSSHFYPFEHPLVSTLDFRRVS